MHEILIKKLNENSNFLFLNAIKISILLFISKVFVHIIGRMVFYREKIK